MYNAYTMWRCVVFMGIRFHPSVIKMKEKKMKAFPKRLQNIPAQYKVTFKAALLHCALS